MLAIRQPRLTRYCERKAALPSISWPPSTALFEPAFFIYGRMLASLPTVYLPDMVRFNEAIDQAIAESVAFFNSQLEHERNLLLGMSGTTCEALFM